MKKFLSKLPVMLAFVIVAVALLGVYVGLIARPVATGMAYTDTISKEDVLKQYGSAAQGLTDEMFTKLSVKSTMVFTGSKTFKSSLKFDYEYSDKATALAKTTFEAMVKSMETGSEDAVTYYYRSGNKVYCLFGATEKTYDDAVKALKARDGWEDSYQFTVSSFAVRPNVDEAHKDEASNLVNTGTIVLTVVLGVVEVALLVFAGLSVAAYTKSKKKA